MNREPQGQYGIIFATVSPRAIALNNTGETRAERASSCTFQVRRCLESELRKKEKQMSDAKVTNDHHVIRKWVEARGGNPSRVRGTGGKGSGVLRIDYPGYSGEETLEAIEWDEFFEGFEENNLAFLYQDETQDGELSRFSKLIERGADQSAAKAKSA